MQVKIPYGTEFLTARLADSHPVQQLRPVSTDHPVEQVSILRAALEQPYGTSRLMELARGKRTALIIASDHTRPVPSKLMMPLLLEELRCGNPEIEITILIAAGCHRATTREELVTKFGKKIVAEERIVQHNSADAAAMQYLGELPSGGPLLVNRLALDTELLLSEGFIEPHFFAGYSGGRKSVLPGIAARESVLSNHNAQFIASPYARAGSLEKNPIHIDMQAAADMAKLQFIFNVILNEEKQIIAAYAGDSRQAHQAGCDYLARHAGVRGEKTPIVLTSNGGYPLDQNLYQCVKGLATAAEICEEGGIIILCAACMDGHGGQAFYDCLRQAESPTALLKEILLVPAAETTPDQWQYQILARILCHHTVIIVTRPALSQVVQEMKMTYAPDIDSALRMAVTLVGASATLTVIPDGVGTFILTEDAMEG